MNIKRKVSWIRFSFNLYTRGGGIGKPAVEFHINNPITSGSIGIDWQFGSFSMITFNLLFITIIIVI